MWLLVACNPAPGPQAPPPAPPTVAPAPADPAVARFRARALYESDHLAEAAEAFEALARSGADPRDHAGLALTLVRLGRFDDAIAAVARAKAAHADSPALEYAAGHAWRRKGDLEKAVAAFQAAHAGAPDAPEATWWLGATLGEAGHLQEALAVLKPLADQGPASGSVHYLPALYRTGQLLIRLGRVPEGQAALETYRQKLAEAGQPSTAEEVLFLGTLTIIDYPPPAPAPPSGVPPRFEWRAAQHLEPAGTAFTVAWLGGAARPPSLVWASGGNLVAWSGGEPQVLGKLPAAGGEVRALAAADVDDDGDVDLYVSRAKQDSFYVRDGAAGRFVDVPVRGRSRAALPADLDEDGDLDWLVLPETGAPRVLRALGPQTGPLPVRFDTAPFGLEAAGPRRGALLLDADGDVRPDLLLWDGAALFRSLRPGAFADVTAATLGASSGVRAALAEDFDHDGRTDLVLSGPDGLVFRRNTGGRFEPGLRLGPPAEALVAGDFDADGYLDFAALDAAGAVQLYLGSGGRFTASRVVAPPLRTLAAADLDGDGLVDLVGLGPTGAEALYARGPLHNVLTVALDGRASNRAGVGAIVEVQAGHRYTRRLARGSPLTFGLGGAAKADVVRIRWPNGAYQALLDTPAGLVVAREPAELLGSCPFLYAWDGERFTFRGDFLGQAPIGIPVAPGVLVHPDVDEPQVLPGEALKARDGRLVLQLKEEYREITYLDEVRLAAVDTPADAYVAADGRCKPPPFPTRDWYASAKVRPVRAARDQDGRDVLPLLAERDGRAVQPFTPTRLPGLVTPHSLELDLGPVTGPKPILYLEGWVFWAGANTNAALFQDPQRPAEWPRLEVPDGHGGWKVAIADLGFPAGTTPRAMPIPLAGMLRPDDPRVRITTNLQVYWDRALVADDGGDLPIAPVPLQIVAADLHFRGLATVVHSGGDGQGPAFWDYDRLVDPLRARWGQLPGGHTPYGDARAAIAAADDRLVTLDAGDELTVAFADLPPPRPGYRRDYLLFTTGYDKDSNVHTAGAEAVGPLPFRAMPGYPFGPETSAPVADDRPRPPRALLPDLRLRALDR